MGESIVDAIGDGFSIATSFGAMVQNAFKSTFLTTTGSTTTLSTFGAIALTLTGVAIVTGICMKVFNHFMGGKI